MIYEALEQLLGELLVDVQEHNVAFSLGDLFEASHFRLQDVFLKTETINRLQLPLELAAGYIGDLKIEGLVGAVTGAPLSLRVSNVCLVLHHAEVEWDNELLLRFAKEFAIALWQSVLVPAFDGKPTATSSNSSAFISPGKWIANRVQTALTDTTVTMENIHVRVESSYKETPLAYGLHIPILRLTTRAPEDQILHRRQQVGVEYPNANATISKLLALENPAFYCQLSAERYWVEPFKPSAMRSSYQRLRECVLRGLPRKFLRDVCSASVVWLKLDIHRRVDPHTGAMTGFALGAVDIVTEGLRVEIELEQLGALVGELDLLQAFQVRQIMSHWRPSAIDRARTIPPSAAVRPDALFPIPTIDIAKLIVQSGIHKVSKEWLRGMWHYAARCILLQRRKGDLRRIRLFNELHQKRQSHYEQHRERNNQRDRYIQLYSRSLTPSALEHVLRGRAALLSNLKSPKRATASGVEQSLPTGPISDSSIILPDLTPLTLDEKWELSDLVWKLPVYDQRIYRAMADHALRLEYGKRSAPPSPGRKISWSATENTHSVSTKETVSQGTSPPPSPPKPEGFPVDFVANHHRITRSATETAMGISPSTSPPLIRVHAASTSALIGDRAARAPSSPTIRPSKTKKTRAPISKQAWFQQTFFPKSITSNSQFPLVNWSLGAISFAFYRTKLPTDLYSVDSLNTARVTTHLPEVVEDEVDEDGNITGRANCDALLEFRVESCSGAVLITKTPTLRALVELRLGLVHGTLLNRSQQLKERGSSRSNVDRSSSSMRVGARRRNWISTDYIRDPADGFFYIGLKYNAKELPAVASTSLLACDTDEWDIKGRVCVGTINVEYNDEFTSRSSTQKDSMPSYSSVLQDVYTHCTEFLSSVRRKEATPWVFASGEKSLENNPASASAPMDFMTVVGKWSEAERMRALQYAKRTRFLNALLLHASMFEVDLGGLQLTVTMPTVRIQTSLPLGRVVANVQHMGAEEVQVEIAPTMLKLQNRPLLDECLIEAGGIRAVFHSTKQGRAAAIQFLAQKIGGK